MRPPALRCPSTALILCVLSSLGPAQVAPGGSSSQGLARWRTPAQPELATDRAAISDVAATALARGDGAHVLVQFARTPGMALRSRAAAAGLTLLRPAAGRVWFAAVDSARFDASLLERIDAFEGLALLGAAWKQHPALIGDVPAHAIVVPGEDPQVAVYALFHSDVELAQARAVVSEQGARVVDTLESVHGLVLEAPRSRLDTLSDLEALQWIEPALPRFVDLAINDSNRSITQADLVQAAPYGLDGSGVNVLVYDGGTARASHVDFGGRLSSNDASGLSDHATHVAATIGGSGSASGGTFMGMAPGVDLESYGFEYDGSSIFLYTNPGDIESDYAQAIATHGADLANNSIGTNTEPNGFPCNIQGDYGVTAMTIDAIVAGSLGTPFRIVWANGNERQGSVCDIEGFGDFYSTAPPATAKNHITVGALNSNNDSMTSFSSWGPTDDGRMKPDISAPGCQSSGDGGVTSAGSGSDTALAVKCGTSMAAPTVTGLCALLIEDYRAQFGGPDPLNSTLKVLLAHNAEDGGDVGPDNEFGYGSVRIRDTIDHMRLGRFDEAALADDGASFVYSVVVGGGDPELRMTLAWDDPAGTPNALGSLVNDLDLRVIAPGGTQHMPWTLDPANPGAPAVQTARNGLDNLEQVLVASPVAGTWRIEVHGYSLPVGPQSFSIAASHDLAVGPFVDIGFPTGPPTAAVPGAAPVVRARVVATGETLVGVPELFWRTGGGAYQSTGMAPVGGDEYEATLPTLGCGQTPEWYVGATGSLSGAATNPPNAPVDVWAVLVEDVTTIFADDFEANLGWSVQNVSLTDGGWDRGVPAGDGGRNDPVNDFDGSGSCWLTDNVAGNSDVDGGPTRVTSPTIDLSSAQGDVFVSYAAWFANDDFDADDMLVEVSDDGGSSWASVQSIGNTSGWSLHAFRVLDYVAQTSQLAVRFSVTDNPNDSVTEAALDAFAVRDHSCTNVVPIAGFSGAPSSGEAPLSVAFSDLSVGNVTTWSWDFGDGSTSNAQSPSHDYGLPGTYTVSLTVDGPSGNDTSTQVDYVVAAKPPAVGSNYGATSPGSLGAPSMEGFSQLQQGQPLYLVGGNVPASAAVVMALSVTAQNPPLDLTNGLLLNVGLPIVIVKPFTADDDGEVIFRLDLTPGLSGVVAHGQVFALDGLGGDLYASSQGLQVTLP